MCNVHPISVTCIWISIAIANACQVGAADRSLNMGLRDGERFELLWPGGAPEAKGDEVIDRPAISVHLPSNDNANGAAVIVNPGGGYNILASDHEGLQVARELNRHGITAFVLRYRVRPRYEPTCALLDAKRAVRHVRHNAKRYGIDPNRLGMLGFSAGGHLASWVGTDFDSGTQESSDDVERQSCRPDFLCLIYPAISGKLFNRDSSWKSTDDAVSESTPPTFLTHTHEDDLTPRHSIQFYSQLLAKKVPAELHVFGHGSHGLGLAPGDPDMRAWPNLFVNWLRRRGMLTDKTPQSINGTVTVDGKPLFWGWVTFVPHDERQPIRAAYIHQSEDGTFKLPETRGLTSGEYDVEVRVVATSFEKPKDGAYSIEDTQLHSTGPNGRPIAIEVSEGKTKAFKIEAGSK